METSDQAQLLKQTRLIFWMNLALSLFVFAVFINSVRSDVTWKIVCSGIACGIFLGITFLLFVRMVRLQKAIKNQNQK